MSEKTQKTKKRLYSEVIDMKSLVTHKIGYWTLRKARIIICIQEKQCKVASLTSRWGGELKK
jgi:hypothetical protein